MSAHQITDIILAIATCITAVMSALGHQKNADKLASMAEDAADVMADLQLAYVKLHAVHEKTTATSARVDAVEQKVNQ